MSQQAVLPAAAPAHDGLPVPRRYWAVSAIWLAMVMSVLDASIANVALPTMARELHASPAASIWIVNSYQLVNVMVLLPFATLGDRLGYRRLYVAGLAVFTLGSLACAFSTTLSQLVAARALQGLGAGGVMSINPALLRFTFPRAMLGKAFALNVIVIAVSSALAPTIASGILSAWSWPWLFAVNVPVGLLAAAVAMRALPDTEGVKRPFDFAGAALNALAWGLLVLGAEKGVREGVAEGLGMLSVGATALIVLVWRDARRPAPLLPVDLLRDPTFAISAGTGMSSFIAQTLALIALPFWLQEALHRTVVETGLLLTPWPVGLALGSAVAGRMSERYHASLFASAGLAICATGLILVALAPPDVANWDFAWRMFICGAGFGTFQAPNNRALFVSSPVQRSGAAGGVLAMARVTGQTVGALVIAVLFHLGGTAHAVWALWLAAAVGFTAAAASLVRLKTQAVL